MKRFPIIQILLILFFVTSGYGAAKKYIQAEIIIDSPEKAIQIKELGLDIVWTRPGSVEIVSDSAELESLKNAGYEIKILLPDMEEFFRSRLAAERKALAVGYKSLGGLIDAIDAFSASYPQIATEKISIGTTFEGRDIWAIKISDNPTVQEDEPEVLFTALIHAREGITPEILLNFMNYLGANYGLDPEVTELVDNRQIWLIPVQNPDGYNFNDEESPGGGGMWRKNRVPNYNGDFGVDLNRNFGYMWGYDNVGSSPNPSHEDYRGTGPFSERETQAIRDFVIAHNFQIMVNFHSYSNLILWAWGYRRMLTPDNDIFSMIGDSVSALNGYNPVPSWRLYLTNGDSDDWGYGEQTTKSKILTFTLEVGNYLDYFWPSISRMPVLIAENLGPCLYFTKIAGNQLSLRPPQRPVMIVPDTVRTTSYTVAWSLPDTINPALNYELTELWNHNVVTDPAGSFTNWKSNGFLLSTKAYSGTTSFYSDSLSPAERYIQSNYPYMVAVNDTLKFFANYNIIDGFDYAYVQVSTDGVNFAPIQGNLSSTEDPYGHNLGYGITGTSSGWVQGLYDLSGFVGQDIYFRFSYSDYDITYAGRGIYIDDIYPTSAFNNSAIISSPLTDTSYEIAGHDYGIYYYKVRGKDAQEQWSDYSLVGEVVNYFFICGDADRSKKINLLDVSYIINYLYHSGPAPVPVMSADVDHSGKINLLDISYIISYLYRSGPAPSCP
jgi:hypothetical protein